MDFENIEVSTEGVIHTITINRPKQLNALNRDTIKELNLALNAADEDHSIRVVIITGSGEKAFVAGADIKEFANFSVEEGKALSADGQKLLFDRTAQMNKPVIAAINGFALGGGLELAMACHVRIASDNARLGLPEVSLGVIPGYGGTQRLAHLVGKGKAMEMITTAGMIKADEAHQWGLVNKVVAQKELMNEANAMAAAMAKNSPIAVVAAMKSIIGGYTDGVDGYAMEIEQFGLCFGTADFKEGTSAFIERRKADFPGK
ncbi:MAG: enoyl-CoA hydratase [Flavobacteriales bacterium]|jgi:enoyl-CoA hydratase